MRKILFAVSILVVTSCHPKKTTPQGIIPSEQMQGIIQDIHYAQTEVSLKSINPDSTNKVTVAYYRRIFRLHHVTAQQFLNSFDYYTEHPDMMDEMYQNMINDLTKTINTSTIKPVNTKK